MPATDRHHRPYAAPRPKDVIGFTEGSDKSDAEFGLGATRFRLPRPPAARRPAVCLRRQGISRGRFWSKHVQLPGQELLRYSSASSNCAMELVNRSEEAAEVHPYSTNGERSPG